MNKKEIIIISIAATIILVLLILLLSNKESLSFHQPDDYISKGNDYFDDEEYDKSVIEYVGATTKDSTNTGALYNNANASYRKGQYDAADKSYEDAARSTFKINAPEESKNLVSSIFHNKGNAGMKQVTPLDSILMTNEMIKEAEAQGRNVNDVKQQFYNSLQENAKKIGSPIKNYKEALRNNPKNDSTRFNLAMAQNYQAKVMEILSTMTPPNQDNQNNQNQDKKDDKKNQQQDQQQQQQQQQQEQKQEQEQSDQMSKDNAEKILKALEEDEKDNIKKRKAEKQDSRSTIEKDW